MTQSVFSERYDRFRQALISARKSASLTQAQVAERMAKPQSFVSKYERGERRLDVVEFFDIAHEVGFDPIKFLRGLGLGLEKTRKRR